MSLPPEDPTRRLPVQPPVDPIDPAAPPPPAGGRGVVYEAAPGPDPFAEILDRLRSLRTALALVGLLSALALGVGIWALLEAQDDNTGGPDRRGASTERVRELEQRVDRVESRAQDAPSEDDLTKLREDQEALDGRVDELQEGATAQEDTEPAGASQESVDELAEQVEQLSATVDALGQRIDAIEQDGAQP